MINVTDESLKCDETSTPPSLVIILLDYSATANSVCEICLQARHLGLGPPWRISLQIASYIIRPVSGFGVPVVAFWPTQARNNFFIFSFLLLKSFNFHLILVYLISFCKLFFETFNYFLLFSLSDKTTTEEIKKPASNASRTASHLSFGTSAI